MLLLFFHTTEIVNMLEYVFCTSGFITWFYMFYFRIIYIFNISSNPWWYLCVKLGWNDMKLASLMTQTLHFRLTLWKSPRDDISHNVTYINVLLFFIIFFKYCLLFLFLFVLCVGIIIFMYFLVLIIIYILFSEKSLPTD